MKTKCEKSWVWLLLFMFVIYFYTFAQITSENRWDSGSKRRNSIYQRKIISGDNRQRQMRPGTYPDRIQASNAEPMDEEYFWTGSLRDDESLLCASYWFWLCFTFYSFFFTIFILFVKQKNIKDFHASDLFSAISSWCFDNNVYSRSDLWLLCW